MIFALFWTASCTQETKTEYVYTVPDLPADLRTTVEVPERKAETLADVGVILADHVEALDRANGKIRATDCIWSAAEEGRPVNPDQCQPK